MGWASTDNERLVEAGGCGDGRAGARDESRNERINERINQSVPLCWFVVEQEAIVYV